MLISKCQTNKRRNQTAPHLPRDCPFAAVADIAVVVAMAAVRARRIKKI